MPPASTSDDRVFVMSTSELARRRAAFDRLLVSIVVAAIVFAIDLIVANSPTSLLLLLALALVMLASRTALASGFVRYARTSWAISNGILLRDDYRTHEEFPLSSVRDVRTKRMTSGGIREIKIDLDGGRSVYVNGIEDSEAFLAALLSGAPHAQEGNVLREVIDFDHPLFYVFLGVAVGISIAVLARVVVSAPASAGTYVYALLAVYSVGVGAFWLRAKPVSGRFGKRSLMSDYAFGLGALVVGLAAALAALLT